MYHSFATNGSTTVIAGVLLLIVYAVFMHIKDLPGLLNQLMSLVFLVTIGLADWFECIYSLVECMSFRFCSDE